LAPLCRRHREHAVLNEERGQLDILAFGTPAVVPAHQSKKLDMKTRVSIPNDVFAKTERLARRSKRSRGELFSAALSEYVARHESTDYAAHSAFNAAAT
jgi:Ribbon-helix-helix protein, copG family